MSPRTLSLLAPALSQYPAVSLMGRVYERARALMP
jgi:hypothetical protein